MNNKKIAFIGMMGSGKSTIAKIYSQMIEIDLFECDEIFEKKHNISIKDFFKKYGESEFRKEETNILADIIKQDSFVLSCGGGVILSLKNREILFNKDIFTIYLEASSETIYDRIKKDDKRPLLLVENPKLEIEKIIKERKKYYEQASLTINTDNKTIDEIIKEINERN